MAQTFRENIAEKGKLLGSLTPGRSIRAKLLFWLLIISLIPMAIIGFVGYKFPAGSLRQQSFDRMESTLKFQSQALEDYLAEQSKNLETVSETLDTLQIQSYQKMLAIGKLHKDRITNAFNQWARDAKMFAGDTRHQKGLATLGANGSKNVAAEYSTFIDKWLQVMDFQSATFISSSGKILYSTDDEIKAGSAIKESSHEWQALQKGMKETNFIDYGLSSLFEEQYVSYFAAPIKQNDKLQAVLLLRLKNEAVAAITKDSGGLGELGEAFVVGPEGMFRSNSRHFDEATMANPSYVVQTNHISEALAGRSGEEIIANYRGEYVLSSYSPINILGTTWALIVEIDQVEAVVPKHGNDADFLQQLVTNFNYPDMYLLSPDGFIIQSAKHLPDYLTNIVTGPYSDTVFATTIAKVIETKEEVVSDYSLYKPAGLLPAAFIARPIKDKSEKIVMIVALQIPIDDINLVMNIHGQSKDKVGSGEAYLVGQDKLWRSESTRAEQYGVKKTLLNPKATIKTKAVSEALAGKSGTEIIINGAGEKVLSSWAPFKYKDLNWAIISEIGQAEVEKPIAGLLKVVGFIAVIATIAVVIVSLLVSGGITQQVHSIIEVMGKVEEGEYEDRAEVKSKDELGQMASSFNNMIDTIQSLLKIRKEEHELLQDSIITLLGEIAELADGDLSVRATVTEGATGTLADSLNVMLAELEQAIGKIKESSEQVGSTANNLSSSTEELTVRNDTQARMISDAVREINDLTVGIERAAEKADQSASTSKASSQVAIDGAAAVEDTSLAMEAIRGNVQDTARAIKRLGESSQEISDFAKTINEISDRTSILALNASIQAASAGEEGRGFAVVAEEIQRLAERAASSTRQIETLIKNILGEITEAGSSMDASIQEVVRGTSLSKNALAKLKDITGRSNEVVELISGVADDSKEQAYTTAKLAMTMDNIGTVSSETAGETQKASSTMRNMAELANDMLQSVATFTLSSTDKVNETEEMAVSIGVDHDYEGSEEAQA